MSCSLLMTYYRGLVTIMLLWWIYAITVLLQDILIRDHSSISSIWFIVFRPGTIFPMRNGYKLARLL